MCNCLKRGRGLLGVVSFSSTLGYAQRKIRNFFKEQGR
ncbi:unnamed protein product, partial [Didymodactylos carnosus]